MKVLFDGYLYSLQETGGINRYFRELLLHFPESLKPTLYGHFSSPHCSLEHPHLRRRETTRFTRFFRSTFLRWCEGFDVIHPTYYHLESPLTWENIPGKIVVTVHDFTFAHYGHLYPKSAHLLADQAAAIRRADRILCVSESTRRDLEERFPECAARCSVTPLAASIARDAKPYSASGGRPYFLYVGSRVFYKNFALTVQALGILNASGVVADLIIAGQPFDESEQEMLKNAGATSWTNLITLPSDDVLASLYRGAVALIYPSLYEGFGLAPLESMTCGTPVIALATSSLPEVVAEGGILLDEPTPEAVAGAAELFLSHPDQRRARAEAAKTQAEKFSWERTAGQTWSVYESLARGEEGSRCG